MLPAPPTRQASKGDTNEEDIDYVADCRPLSAALARSVPGGPVVGKVLAQAARGASGSETPLLGVYGAKAF